MLWSWVVVDRKLFFPVPSSVPRPVVRGGHPRPVPPAPGLATQGTVPCRPRAIYTLLWGSPSELDVPVSSPFRPAEITFGQSPGLRPPRGGWHQRYPCLGPSASRPYRRRRLHRTCPGRAPPRTVTPGPCTVQAPDLRPRDVDVGTSSRHPSSPPTPRRWRPSEGP